MESKDCNSCGRFSPDFCRRKPGRCIESLKALPAIQRNPQVQVNFVSFGSLSPQNGKKKQILVCSKHRNTLGNIGNAVKVIVGTQSARENVRQ